MEKTKFHKSKLKYLSIDQCKHGYLYKIYSRNLKFGVFNENAKCFDNKFTKGFIGIREKFKQEYLFTEYHWDCGEPFGTVKPVELLEKIPDNLIISDLLPDPTEEYAGLENKDLFNYLKEIENKYEWDVRENIKYLMEN